MASPARRYLAIPALCALAASCASVEWRELPEDAPHAAADAYLQTAEVARTVREVGGVDPGPGLVIAVSRGVAR